MSGAVQRRRPPRRLILRENANTMKCAKCGNTLDADALFCGQCGGVVGASYAKPEHSANFPQMPSHTPALAAAAPAVTGLVDRVKAILLRPRTEWPAIAAEPTTAAEIYLNYVVPLAAIGAIALFVGQVVFGTAVPLLGMIRAGIVEGLVAAGTMFVLSLASVLVLTHLVDAMAVKFGGQRDTLRALKVIAYSYTPAWLAGALHIVPPLSGLSLFASLYGVYLLFAGLPLLMRCPKPQAVGYALSVVAAAIVLFAVLGALTNCVAGFGPIG